MKFVAEHLHILQGLVCLSLCARTAIVILIPCVVKARLLLTDVNEYISHKCSYEEAHTQHIRY
jgi:hypothetical protein